MSEANKALLDLESKDQAISSTFVKNEIKNPLTKKSFNEISQEFIKELEDNGKLTRLSSTKPLINHLIEFGKSDNLQFHEIDEAFLKRYMVFLKK